MKISRRRSRRRGKRWRSRICTSRTNHPCKYLIPRARSPQVCPTRTNRSRSWLIKILLEAGENVPDLFRFAQVGPGVGDRIVVFHYPDEERQEGHYSTDCGNPRPKVRLWSVQAH